MAASLFVTGTDTGVGKTVLASALVLTFQRAGVRVAGMKPVASGADFIDSELRNEDALALMKYASVKADYSVVNPYCFAPAIAPHIAAADANVRIDLATLVRAHERLTAQSDIVIAEGAGGWLTPLNDRETLADFARAIDARVVLVVGLRLGCINHALLTAAAVEAAGLKLGGWIGNAIDPNMPRQLENIETLTARLRAPRLGLIPFSSGPTAEHAAGFLDASALLSAAGIADELAR